jgi:hypothetical protein
MTQRACVLAVFLGLCFAPGNLQAQAPTVHVLHQWLADQCSFVPDIDAQVSSCCGAHDVAYSIGGTGLDRLLADLEFRHCIRQDARRPVIAEIYYAGVRLFGWLFFNFAGSASIS